MTRAVARILALAAALALSATRCADYESDDTETPPEPVTLEIVAAGDTTVTLRWTQSDDEYFRQYQVYYSTNDIVDTTHNLADSLSFRQDTVKVVSGLDPNTHYYFRVIVVDQYGLIGPSNIVDTITLRDISQSLELLPPESVTDTSVTLRWTRSRLTNVQAYLIYRDTTATVDSTDTLAATVHSDTSWVVAPLKRDKSYWFRVYARDRSGTVIASNTQSAHTLSGIPHAVHLWVDSLADTVAFLRWSANHDSDFARYVVCRDTVALRDTLDTLLSGDPRLHEVRGATDTSLALTGLLPDRLYWFRVYVEDRSELHAVSNLDSAKTDDGVPDAVTLTLVGASDSTVTLRWSRNTEADFSRYVVRRDTTPQVGSGDTAVATKTAAGDTSCTVPGLAPGKQYWFAVFVENRAGADAASNTVVNFPVILRVTSETDSAVGLAWSQSGAADFYAYMVYRGMGPGVTDDSLSLTPATISNVLVRTYTDSAVDSGSTYWYRVYHYERDSLGVVTSQPSNEVSATCQ